MFRTNLNPVSPGQSKPGTVDSPILLSGITAKEFEILLWVFYNPYVCEVHTFSSAQLKVSFLRKYSLYNADVETWELILCSADKLELKEVKELAIRELEKENIPDSKRIKLYHAHNVDRNILIPHYVALCEREAPLTLEEAEDIGLETVTRISAIREEARASRRFADDRSPISPTIRGVDLYDIVRDIFHIAPAETIQVGIDDYIFLI